MGLSLRSLARFNGTGAHPARLESCAVITRHLLAFNTVASAIHSEVARFHDTNGIEGGGGAANLEC